MSVSNGPFRPAKRSLGQNFLVDENTSRRIVAAVDPGESDIVVEIGPGRGALTRFLAEAKPKRCIALEKDHALAESLAQTQPQVEVIDGDALNYDWDSLAHEQLKIVGNLPYNVASRIIWEIVSRVECFDRAVFMVQHEVGLRLTAKFASKQYGAISVWVQSFCELEYLFKVPPTVFRPQPRIDSAVVRFMPRPRMERPEDAKALSRLLKICFQKRRKQLKNILKEHWNPEIESWFENMGVSPTLRPEALSPIQFEALSKCL